MTATTDPLLDFKALPKIELHAHLSGSISPQTLHEVWRQNKASNPLLSLPDPLIALVPGQAHSAHDLASFFTVFSKYTYHLIDDAASLTYTTLSVLRDFAADGVAYLELRTTPRALPTPSAYVSTVLSAIRHYEATTVPLTMRTNLILSIDRRNPPSTATSTLALAIHHSSPTPSSPTAARVVGLDLCGDPSSTSTVPALLPVFHQARLAAPHLGLTLHFAESRASSSDAELEALLACGPDRLGHVIHVHEGVKGRVIDLARRRGAPVGLELCLSCNVQLGMVEGGYGGHHFKDWMGVEGCRVVLATDDVGVFGSPLSNEYRIVANEFGLGRAEICALARGAVDVIFGGEAEKERLRGLMWE
ncbi:Metallo-dependent hydrolase [Podospora conica]|nr:Metallo-dependent hydrolase [Schizothecium conicum]